MVTSPHSASREILAQMNLEEKIALLSGSALMRTSGIPRLGLHPAKVTDSPMGINGDGLIVGPSTTVVPNATALSATWDLDLVRSVGRLLGSEAKWKEGDVYLAPTLNLHRDPRGGRNQESFGEDGYLAGKVGAAFVSGVHDEGIAVCAKHLVCNESETDRKDYDVIVDEQTLRQVYLRPFEILVKEASPRTIMTSYNKLNGTAASQNEQLLRLVREEWKWDGMFMSDWSGTYDGIASLKAGLDLEMPFPHTRGPKILEAIKQGSLTEAELDVSCERIIKLLQDVSPLPASARTVPDRASPLLPETVALNRRAASEAMILIKNNGILPLDPSPSSKKVLAVIGPLATARNISQLLIPAYLVKPLDGIRAAIAEASGGTSNLDIVHSDGVYVHRCIPKLDHRFSTDIQYNLWEGQDRTAGGAAKPYSTRHACEAVEAYVTSPVPLEQYEFEMTATVTVPTTGTYILSVISGYTAQVYVDDVKIYDYAPEGEVPLARFLFEMHELERTFTHPFRAGGSYALRVVTQSHPVGSIVVPGQGLMVGMVLDIGAEDLLTEAVRAARSADMVCVFVGTTHEWEMEGVDRTDIQLPCGQAELVKAVLAVQPNTVVINQSGGAVDLTCADGAAAILHAHIPGQESGHAIADVLFGKVNPGGKSPFSWPKRLEDCPTASLFPRKEDMSLAYSEGLSNGYAGYIERGMTPAICFGHGLSYTTFELSDASLKGTVDSGVGIATTVRNTGKVPGKHVVQVYVRHPSGVPYKSLEGFARTGMLAPGESETVNVSLGKRSFAKWDLAHHEWKVEVGKYAIEVANSAEDVFDTLSFTVESSVIWRGL